MKDFTLHSPFGDGTDPEEKTMPELLIRWCKHHAKNGKTSRITDAVTGESFTFDSFDQLSGNIASALFKRGFRSGDVVIYMMYDLTKLHIFLTGVWRCNGVPRASYPEDDEETLLDRVTESRVGWIYCDPKNAKTCLSVAAQAYWDVEVIVTGDIDGCTSVYELMEDDGTEIPQLDRQKEDPAVIFCTSGTTGKSKGAVLSHEALMEEIRLFRGKPFDLDHVNLIISKGTHMSGCVIPAAGILDGFHSVTMASLTVDNVFRAIEKYQPTHIFSFPALLVTMINHPLSQKYDLGCLQSASCGGAPMTTAIEKIVLQLPNMKTVSNIYGLTEVGPVITTIDFDSVSPVHYANIAGLPENCVGKLVRGVQAQFRDIETGTVLGPSETGELFFKAKGMFYEYLNNPEATQGSIDNDGYFKTGDIGYYDENEFIFIIDRAKEIFKYFGNHVSPTEIENVINNHPDVGEVCVIGVPDNEGGGGHVPRAFCVILQGASCTSEEVRQFADDQLPDYKRLRGGVYFVKALPKGNTGKVARQLVEKIEIGEI